MITRFSDGLLRPFILLALIAVAGVQLAERPLVWPTLTIVVFALVALGTIATLFDWARVPEAAQIAFMAGYVVLAAALVPLAIAGLAPAFAFVATGAAGLKLRSARAAVAIAVLCAVATTVSVRVVAHLHPGLEEWSWWLSLTTGLPVFAGLSSRAHREALASAQKAAAEAERALESETREAALLERARIAREVHDVLGHSLSGIALQLDMADALHGSGRDDEANTAVRRARSMAVGGITETRRAIHALREGALPLAETLRLLGESENVPLEIAGEPVEVPVETTHAVVRAAQEALANAAKYAPGAARTLTLEFTGSMVRLTVANEPGGPAASSGGTGLGLVGMRERAALLGGSCQAGPRPGGGWLVELEVPA